MKNFNPSYYANARHEIEPLLPSNISSVLEIGCSEGNTLMWLRDSESIETCRGIEILPDVAARAKEKGLDIVVADIERDGIPFKDQYDLVLCLDVLEHLNNPWSTMKAITESIKPGGYFIASIPNIGHISILSDLVLHDRFDYTESGILDRTHLRFFTGTTARQLLVDAGLEVLQQRSRFARKTHRRLNFLTLGLFKRFFTFQTLLLATKKVHIAP
ncbi:MAG: class I SAM-dependent methyltransferase [Candidatus Ferrigenium altingense]|jgi:2-polyprenyl-3-methyl-5-hydroxy-6-metoxy-1,4-benzoquinol methylase